MNIELREFQDKAVADLVDGLRSAARDARRGRPQAVSLSSPTGSGKTVMLIEAIERILQGDDEAPGDPEATFLWITDQPELNAQTRDKMHQFSTVLSSSTLTVLDTEYDAEQLTPGQVYFLNTQKLGRNSLLVASGDRRTFTMWETIENTVKARPGSFYVVIDEAHRGMQLTTQARNEANSIIQKFILGSPDELSPVPLIVGISATPQRFNDLMAATQKAGKTRTTCPVVVDATDVRGSGLIKDAIQFVHPSEKQPSDMTMLREAVKSWLDYKERWKSYCVEQNELPVRPILAVQVADAPGGTSKALSQTDLAEALSSIEDVAGALPPRSLAHAFQDHSEITVASQTIRHIPPSEIAADPDAQIVFFKTSLTTGWDCPRAEVMMSFRTAADATNIAQLVGRMVRTPLTRKIEADEHLNTVALFLPHYDESGLKTVIERLTGAGSDAGIASEVRLEPMASLTQAAGSEDAFKALASLPSYTVPRTPTPNETKRLMKLALRLSMDGIRPNAPDQATDLLLGVIDKAYERVEGTAEFNAIVHERDTLDIQLVSYLYGEESLGDKAASQISVSPENVEDLFEAAGRKIGEGLHRDWRNRRVERAGVNPRQAKLEFVALATADLKRALDNTAKEQAQTWSVICRDQIRSLPESKRLAYDEIQGLAGEPEVTSIVYPETIEAKIEGETWPRHLYADARGEFQAKFNDWETLVLRAELKRLDLRGWLRIVPRKSWALTIPYGFGGKAKPVYVDFLFVRELDGRQVVDIIDPHNPNLGDAAPKLVGLAEYAEKHGESYGRIESIIVVNDELRRLNLQAANLREKAKLVTNTSDVLSLFEQDATTTSSA